MPKKLDSLPQWFLDLPLSAKEKHVQDHPTGSIAELWTGKSGGKGKPIQDDLYSDLCKEAGYKAPTPEQPQPETPKEPDVLVPSIEEVKPYEDLNPFPYENPLDIPIRQDDGPVQLSAQQVSAEEAKKLLDGFLLNQDHRDIWESYSEKDKSKASKNHEEVEQTKKIPANKIISIEDRIELGKFLKDNKLEIEEVNSSGYEGDDSSFIKLKNGTIIYHLAEKEKVKRVKDIVSIEQDQSEGHDTREFWEEVLAKAPKTTKKKMIKEFIKKTVGLKKLKTMTPEELDNFSKTISDKALTKYLLDEAKSDDKDLSEYFTFQKFMEKYPELDSIFLGNALNKAHKKLALKELGLNKSNHPYRNLVNDQGSPLIPNNPNTKWRIF